MGIDVFGIDILGIDILVHTPRGWVNSLATWLEWSTVTQEFWVRILADPKIFPLELLHLPVRQIKSIRCTFSRSRVVDYKGPYKIVN